MKNLNKLGKALTKAEQKTIFGGGRGLTFNTPELCSEGTRNVCVTDADCCSTSNETCNLSYVTVDGVTTSESVKRCS